MNIEAAYYDSISVNGYYCYNFEIPPEEEEPEEFISGIYPNPTSGELTFTLENGNIEEVSFYTTAWQLVLEDLEISE